MLPLGILYSLRRRFKASRPTRTRLINAHRGFEGLFGTVTVAVVRQNLTVIVERGSAQLRR